MKPQKCILVLIAGAALASSAYAQDHWVTTWAAAPQQPAVARPPAVRTPVPGCEAPAPPPAAPGGQARGGIPPAPTNFNDQTVRMIVHTSIGGRRARVTLTNAYGTTPLQIGAAHVALRGKESEIVAGSDRILMFNGKPTTTIPQGAQMISDPIDLNVPSVGDLAVSVYIAAESGPPTNHGTGLHTTYIAKGNVAGERVLNDTTTTRSYYFVSAIEVMAPADTGALVTFGDSITDGATSTNDTDRSWPSVLANRLITTPNAPKLSVVNQGISGNRLLVDGAGVNALARFDRDVLSMSGVKWLIVMEGINDIGNTLGGNGSQTP